MGYPVIISRPIAGGDLAVQFSNSYISRELGIPSGWTTIRVGARWHMTDSGDSLPGSGVAPIVPPLIALGVCAGRTHPYGKADSSVHFAGAHTNLWSAISRQATFYGGIELCPAVVVGATVTKGTNWITNPSGMAIGNQAAANAADFSAMFVDITKGSPNYSLRCFFASTNGSTVSFADWFGQMTQASPVLTNHTYATAQTIAVSEATNGTFDSINFYYDPVGANLEIADLGFVQLA